MATDKFDFHTIDYSVQGWDAIMTTDWEKADDVIPSRIIVVLGETVAAFDALYQSIADSKWYKARANGTLQPARGIALEGGILNASIRLIRMGEVTCGSWSYVGRPIYLSAIVAGGLTQKKMGANAQIMGYAKSATVMEVEVEKWNLPALTTTTTTTTTAP